MLSYRGHTQVTQLAAENEWSVALSIVDFDNCIQLDRNRDHPQQQRAALSHASISCMILAWLIVYAVPPLLKVLR